MFYDNLLAVCSEKGLKLTPVVVECGGKSGSISGWKKGAWPSSEIVVALAMRLNVSTDRLLLGADTKQEAPDEIEGITVEGLRVGTLWEQLDEPGRAIVLGDIYKRLEAASREAVPDAGQRPGRVG